MPALLEVLRDALAPRYEVERQLGAGGMATVFLARDTRHQRKVAVKVLRAELATELGHERFLREIGIAAKLQHPHILTLIESGEADGLLYYVMPHVEGESLRSRLAREKRLPVSEAVRILRDVADALAHAHSYGVVHRDIKPGNVMLSGRHALVVDFGVAKAVSSAGHDTLTTKGISLGTPIYMSPEQAMADPQTDHRADIYALGVLGYELLAGEPPLNGDTPQAIVSAHVLTPPRPLGEVRTDVPHSLADVLMRCLEKKPEDRWQSAGEVLERLEGLATPSGGTQPVRALASRTLASAARFPLRRPAFWMAGVALAVIVVGVTQWLGRAPGGPAVPASFTQLTFSGNVIRAQISPDGDFLAYLEAGKPTRLLVRDLTGERAIEIATIERAGRLRWTPDGSSLLLATADSTGPWVAVYPRLGGAPRFLPTVGSFVAWSPDESRIAELRRARPGARNQIVLTATDDTTLVNTPDSLAIWNPNGDWSPDGRSIALLCQDNTAAFHTMLWTVALDGSGSRLLVRDTVVMSPPRWSPRGDALYYLRRNELRKTRVTPAGEIRGDPEVLEAGLDAAIGSGLSLSADGRKLVFVKHSSYSNLWSLAVDSAEAGARLTPIQLTGGTASMSVPSPSPDGEWIAFTQYRRNQGGDIYVIPGGGGEPRRVTSSGEVASAPAWSPDGRALAHVAKYQGAGKVRTVSLEGGREHTYEETNASVNVFSGGDLVWAPGERILYRRSGSRAYYLLDPATEAEQLLVANDSVRTMGAVRYSPTAEYVAVEWNRAPNSGVWAVSLRDSSQSPLLRKAGPLIGWSADGGSVYSVDYGSGDILRVPLTGGEAVVVTTLPFESRVSCAATEREIGLTLLCTGSESVWDAWMIEDFDPDIR